MIQPIHDLVLVKREPQVKQEGSIMLPEDRIEQSLWVEVLASGPGKLLKNGKRSRMNAIVGKKMLLRQWSGLRLEPELGFMSPMLIPDGHLEAFLDE